MESALTSKKYIKDSRVAIVESQSQQCLVRSAGKEQSGAVVRRARLFDWPPCCVVNVQVQVEGVVLIVPNC